MTNYSVKQFRLLIALTISLGLGFGRTLPVQASAIVKPADRLQLDNYQFKLTDPASPRSAHGQPKAAATQRGSSGAASGTLSTQAAPATASRSQTSQPANGQEGSSFNGFSIGALGAVIALIIYNLFHRGGGKPAEPAELAKSPAPPITTEGTGPTVDLSLSDPAGQEEPGEKFVDPVAVPTPALLPGLLALGLKLRQKQKAEAQTVSELKVS
ncbi:MAG: PTPA-CTERM sorting domain-containing protein [Nodosilinea sp.]